MNSFSNMEINDLLDNRFRLEEKHTPNYLAECFQRLFPTLGRMGLSTVIDEMARANHRAFNSSKLPIRGETLDLNFFFELWKRNFRFEGGIYDKFAFGDELRLAFRINPREFWEVLIRADRYLGNYLKDSIELLKYRDLPKEISLNLRPNGSSVDDKTIRLLREKLPYSKENVTTHEIAKICLQLFEVANPADYDVRRLAEELEKENGIRRLSGEPLAVLPKKALDRLSTRCVLEFFKSKPLASNEASAMERGVYTVTEADLVLINSQGSEAFWQSIIPDKSIRERTLNMWKLAGMDSDARRFAKGKQILIATERALSDALHKHSAEMRDVYPLCGRAGISTQEADKFMAMLYLCHDFYPRLETVNITPRFLAGLKNGHSAPAAREVWTAVQSEGLKEGGIQKVNEMLSLKEFKMEEVEAPAYSLPPAQKMEVAVRTEDFNLSSEESENLTKGYYEYRESDLQYMQANGNSIAPIIARIKYNYGAFDIYGFRQKAGLPKDSPKNESGHEDRLLFVGVKAGYDAAKERCKEEIELLKFLLPANSGNIEKDLIFLALHRGYKQQKAARALSRETIALVKEAATQKRGKAYEEKVWRDLCNAKEFNEWPLRPYGDSLNTLTGNISRVADYIKILKAEMAAYPQITETSFGQKIKNMLNKGGEWLEDITKGIGAIITEWRGIKKEEDEKIEQRAVQEKFPKPENIAADHNTNTTPSAVRYWKVKSGAGDMSALSTQLDALFDIFIRYLETKKITIKEEHFTVTDGERSIEEQLYYILDDRRTGGTIYHTFRNHENNKASIDAIPTNENIGSSAAGAASNSVIQDLKSKLSNKWGGDDKLIAAMVEAKMYHVDKGAVDISIRDEHAERLITIDKKHIATGDFRKFEGGAVLKIVKTIGIHSVGSGSEHVHIIFR